MTFNAKYKYAEFSHWFILQTTDKWWDKNPTIAGEGLTPVQSRLSQLDSFTGMYKRRFDQGEDADIYPVTGDLCQNPKRAIRLLKDRSRHQLTIPKRACDFRSEVEWRLTLRNVEDNKTY